MRARWLTAVVLAAAMVPGTAEASNFTVVTTLLPINGGYIVQAHTRIGATCVGVTSIPTRTGTRPLASRFVGKTGIVTWTWHDDVRIGAYTNITCTWHGQQRQGDAIKLPAMPAANPDLVFGGTRAAWESVLGPPTLSGGRVAEWWYCFYGMTPRIMVYDNYPTKYIHWISAGPCSQTTIPQKQWLAEAERFLPADAVYLGTTNGDSGTDYEFRSATVATEFDPAFYNYLDCNGNTTARGTLSIRLGSAGDPSDTGWDMMLGTCT